jgi:hypothetical protein
MKFSELAVGILFRVTDDKRTPVKVSGGATNWGRYDMLQKTAKTRAIEYGVADWQYPNRYRLNPNTEVTPFYAECMESLTNTEELCKFTGTRYINAPYPSFGYHEEYIPERGESISYGDLKAQLRSGESFDPETSDPKEWFLMPRYMSGSDYSGSSVEVSNMRAFKEEYGDESFCPVYGDYGTYAVAIRLDWLTPAIWESLTALENYPVYDDQCLQEVETEAEEEAWENWAKSDFKRELEKRFESEAEDAGYPEFFEQEIPEHALRVLFECGFERSNAEWIHEQGNSAWVDLERVTSVLVWSDVLAVFLAPRPVQYWDSGASWAQNNMNRWQDKLGNVWVYEPCPACASESIPCACQLVLPLQV